MHFKPRPGAAEARRQAQLRARADELNARRAGLVKQQQEAQKSLVAELTKLFNGFHQLAQNLRAQQQQLFQQLVDKATNKVCPGTLQRVTQVVQQQLAWARQEVQGAQQQAQQLTTQFQTLAGQLQNDPNKLQQVRQQVEGGIKQLEQKQLTFGQTSQQLQAELGMLQNISAQQQQQQAAAAEQQQTEAELAALQEQSHEISEKQIKELNDYLGTINASVCIVTYSCAAELPLEMKEMITVLRQQSLVMNRKVFLLGNKADADDSLDPTAVQAALKCVREVNAELKVAGRTES